MDKHVLVRSVGLHSPIAGGHPKSSSHANPDAQLHCVSGRPTEFYLDNASDSVADFHQYLRWYDFLGQLPITTDSQNHIRDPLTSSLAAIPETHPNGCLICVQWYRRQFWTRENKARFIKNLFNTTFLRLVFLPSRPFDPFSAPIGWVAKSLVEVILNIAQTLAFVAYRTAMGNLFRVLWILPGLSTPFCVYSFLKDMFHIPSLWETMFGDLYQGPCPEHKILPRRGLIPTTALSRWIVVFVWRAYERLGKQIPPAHPGLCTQMCPLPKNIMPNRDIFPTRTGIPRTPGWKYQPCTLDGDISASFQKE